jgi:RNA polymerase sigma-70 factor (ECF subfamily)
MSAQDSFALLIQQLLAGHPLGADKVYRRFADRLLALARVRLDHRLRGKADPEDVVLSALRSFLTGCAEGQFTLQDPDQLWNLLTLITLRKCRRQARHYLAECRDVRREEAPAGEEDSGLGELLGLDREPTPEEAAEMQDLLEQVVARLGKPLKRRVFELSLQGYSVQEIAEQVNYYERGVERIRAEVRQIASELLAE